jgi:CHASE3 domain sensor protein
MKIWAKLACYFVVANTVVTVVNFNLIHGSTDWVVHSYQVQVAIKEVMADVRDVEVGTRGFVITKEERFLQSFYRGRQELVGDLQRLVSLTADNATQRKYLEDIRPAIIANHELMDKSIASLRKNSNQPDNSEQFLNMVKDGRQTMTVVRRGIEKMEREEERVLSLRTNRLRWANNWMWVNIGTFIAMQVGFFSAMIYNMFNRKPDA